MEFQLTEDGRLELRGDEESISWGKENLIYKAASLLKEKYGVVQGVSIHVKKSIPPGKGLGGGSSNAAMTLFALNRLWSLGLSKNELMKMGSLLGADVPYFFEGGLCLGLEKGNKVFPLEDLREMPCVLVFPPFAISTRFIYNEHRPSLTSEGKESKITKFLSTKEIGSLENNLEETVFNFYPRLKEIKSLLLGQGAELSLLSGTGSAIFGLFRQRKRAEESLRELERHYPSLLVETISRKKYFEHILAGE